jgi:NDP-sugar pyrophosphorylase family protein
MIENGTRSPRLTTDLFAHLTACVATMVSSPEFTAVILAATTGARLFPMTSVDTPKHTLPVAGVPVVLRLLQSVAASGFLQCVVTLAKGDSATLTLLKEEVGEPISDHVFLFKEKMQVTVHILSEECAGSAEALSQIHNLIAPDSHLVVLPGDLVVFEASVLAQLVDVHRQSNLTSNVSTACTMLLSDVGEQDEHGVPLKESSKVCFSSNAEHVVLRSTQCCSNHVSCTMSAKKRWIGT